MPTDQTDLYELLFRLLDNEISDSDFTRLTNWLKSDQRARQTYCSFMEDFSALSVRATTAIQEQENLSLQSELFDENFWERMSEEECSAPKIQTSIPEQGQKPDIIQKVRRERAVGTINKTSLSVAVAAIAALFTMILYVQLSGPVPYEVATLTDSLNAKWLSDVSMKPQTRISAYTKPMQLVQGMAKITTDDGVEIVIEAPTEFQFVSYSEIALSYGKLFARVSRQGYGFSVATPNAKVVDLGTEFAVLCHIDGNTEVHMYKGKANLFAGQKSESKISELLTAGAAKIVDRTDSIIRNVALAETLVVRNIDSKTKMVWKGQNLNLADVVGGGNGFGSGMPNAGINVLDGQIADRLLTVDTVAGQEGYRIVPENKYIDGVFIPGINGSICKIASPGLTAAFPKTSGALWGYIFNGAMHKGMTTPEHALQLNNVTLGTAAAPAVCIHSNQGITFDLAEIRKDLQGLKITGFRAQTGISQTVQAALEKEGNRSFEQFPDIKQVFDAKQSKAEFWVFLDGQMVYQKELSNRDEPDGLTIPIGPADRFLTLAVTESDDTQAYDWAVFARPVLTMELSEP